MASFYGNNAARERAVMNKPAASARRQNSEKGVPLSSNFSNSLLPPPPPPKTVLYSLIR
jgi:hypothetical protein